MKCNFCGGEIDINQEWFKKSIFEKLRDIGNYYLIFDFSFFGDDKLSTGILKAVGQAGYFIISSLLLLGAGAGIFYPIFDLMDKYVFLKPLFNSTVPNITISNTILPVLGAIILLTLFFYVTYLMFKSDLERNFKKIFNRNNTSIKCPHCSKKNKLVIQYLNDEPTIKSKSRQLTEKEKKNNNIWGISIILVAILAFIIFLSLGNNLHNFLDPTILWTIAIIFVGCVVLIFVNKFFSDK